MSIADRIENNLNSALNIKKLKIEDDSQKHAGHAGWKEGGETHFNILVISNDFKGKSKVIRHKLIYKALEKELEEKIHALSIKAFTEEEFSKSDQESLS